MDTPLLKTKLHIPPVRPELVSRPRLIRRLDEALHLVHRLTLVSAPAGYGKTTLVAEWTQQTSRPVAWLSLEEGDNDPVRFWRYIIAAIQTLYITLGESVLAALQSPHPPGLESLITVLVNEITAISKPFILVLDDYHVITDPAIHCSLGFLLDHLPPHTSPGGQCQGMHLVIATRADPPLSLPCRRVHGELAELRTADLAFTMEEAVQFLTTVAGLDLLAEDIATLETRTEGWIVGLQMAAIALRSVELSPSHSPVAGQREFVTAFAGDDRYIVDYLVEEVLQRQPPHVQTFLLRTSVLERLCGPLCDAVTGRTDGHELLGYLERANLFTIPLDNRRHWYRYHHLFADLLRQRLLQQVGEAGLASLHLRASEWYERAGLVAEAASEAFAASDFSYAADLIERYGFNLLFRGEVVLVRRWLSALPEDLIRSRPFLCVIYAWSEFLSSWSWYSEDVTELVEPWLQDAQSALMAEPRGADDRVDSYTAALRALLSFYDRGELQQIVNLSHHALDCLPLDELGLRSAVLHNLGFIYQGMGEDDAAEDAFATAGQLWQAGGYLHAPFTAVHEQAWFAAWRGRLHQAATVCQQALESITDPSPIAGLIYHELGGILLEQGDLYEAERVLLRARELLKLAEWPERTAAVYGNLARLRQAQGDLARAHKLVDEMERLAPSAVWHYTDLRVRLWLAQAERDPRYLARALRWAEDCGVTWEEDQFFYRAPCTLIRVRLAQRRAGRWVSSAFPAPESRAQTALKPIFGYLDRYLRYAQKWGATGQAIEALALQALALETEGDVSQAMIPLQQALALGEPEGYINAFVQEGAPMACLLRQVAVRGPATDYVRRLLAAFPGTMGDGVDTSAPSGRALVEPLSPREMQVLQLIAAGASNPEIARELFITVNTVKRHVTHILRKLGVSNRTQAATQARELGLTSAAER